MIHLYHTYFTNCWATATAISFAALTLRSCDLSQSPFMLLIMASGIPPVPSIAYLFARFRMCFEQPKIFPLFGILPKISFKTWLRTFYRPNLIPRALLFSLLFISVMAEPNALVKVIITPFQNRSHWSRAVMNRVHGKADFVRDWRQVLPYILCGWRFHGYSLSEVLH